MNAQISPGELHLFSNATFWSDTGENYRKWCTQKGPVTMESPKGQVLWFSYRYNQARSAYCSDFPAEKSFWSDQITVKYIYF